uniref:Uncharacterized protein MANES_03G114800 n=1 Tax=Rhizophora mucronata TaxID=61149 RepID=A0A2P2KJJ8_RHIMU
MSRCKASEL